MTKKPPPGRKSKYDLDNAFMYLRLGFQAMHEDQEWPKAKVDEIVRFASDRSARLQWLAEEIRARAVILRGASK